MKPHYKLIDWLTEYLYKMRLQSGRPYDISDSNIKFMGYYGEVLPDITDILKYSDNNCGGFFPYSGLCWDCLSKNPSPGSIYVIEKYINFINWEMLSENPNAIHILEKNLNKVNWILLSSNPNAIHLLEKNFNKIDWKYLSKNPNAIPMLEKNMDKVDWAFLSSNPNAIPMLEKNMDKVDWAFLSSNPNAIHLLEKNINKVDWKMLSSNPNAIHLLEKNLDKIAEYYLSSNPNALHIFKKINEKRNRFPYLNWLSMNPSIFVYDYEKMKEEMFKSCLAEEIAQKVFHPSRLNKICETYNIEFDELMEIY